MQAVLLMSAFISSWTSYASDSITSLISANAECSEEEQTPLIPTCLFDRTRPETAAELIMGDVSVCRCLERGSSLLQELTPLSAPPDPRAKERERRLGNLDAFIGNAGIIQSSKYVPEDSPTDFLVGYSASEARIQSANVRRGSGLSSEGPRISDQLLTLNSIPEENSSWQCVTYHEYNVQREVPYGNDFFLALKNLSTFVAAEWDVRELQRRYSSASQQEKEVIRARLVFLSRNPIFERVFKARSDIGISQEVITQKQNALFEIILSLRQPEGSSCYSVPNACWRQAHENGTFEAYSQNVKGFLEDPQVMDISSAQSSRDYLEALATLTDENFQSTIPTDPEAYFQYLQTASPEIARSCYGEKVEASCYTQFREHCEQVRRIDSRVRQGMSRDISDISALLEEEAFIHARMNPEDNPQFRSFNDTICLQSYTNAQGESSNFFQFQENRCRGEGTPLPECSNRQELLKRFLAEHNSGGTPENQNIRSGFANLIGEASFGFSEVTEAQIEAVNNITETPRQIRERFNGRFPTITPTGEFVAPMPLSTGNPGAQAVSFDVPETVIPSVSSFPGERRSSSYSDGGINSFTQEDFQLSQPSSNGFNQLVKNFSTSTLFHNPSVGNEALRNPLFEESPNLSNSATQPEEQRTPASASGSQAPEKSPLENNRPLKAEVSSASTPSLVAAGEVQNGVAPSRSLAQALGEASVSPRVQKSTPGLFFKYNLDREGNAIQPDLAIVPPISKPVGLIVSRREIDLLRANPNALELSEDKIQEIMSSPESEVELVIETQGGESLTVFAKKDGSGGLSYSLTPTAASASRAPASTENIIRINVNSEVYDNVVRSPDSVLNRDSSLTDEIKKYKGSDVILQMVSPGKNARVYQVRWTVDGSYSFKEKPL